MFILLSIIGMTIDLLFLTNLYQRKKPIKIKEYWIMIFTMGTVTVITIYLFKEWRITLQIVSYLIIIFLFYKNYEAISFFSFSFVVYVLIDVFITASLSLQYGFRGMLSFILKTFLILVVFKELNPFVLLVTFKTITQKVFFIIFSFVCLLFGMYINLNWR